MNSDTNFPEERTPWLVEYAGKAKKQKEKLRDEDIEAALFALKNDLEQKGPEQGNWQNYSPIVGAKDYFHCHLNNNRPRYVVVWKVTDWENQEMDIRFVGPHGSVNYQRFK